MTVGVCMPNPTDGGASDALLTDGGLTDGHAEDARADAGPSDGESKDARDHKDGGDKDGGASMDGTPSDNGFSDNGFDDALPGDAVPVDAAPGDAEPGDGGGCMGLQEQMCLTTHGCEAHYCMGCNSTFFSGCTETGAPPPPCPLIVCPVCTAHADETSCRADSNCHPVFADQTPCTCSPVGCCMHYSFCAEGRPALCMGTPTCGQAPPLCEGNYQISYTQTCYEGCVTPDECR
jgi:hypothetical protein